MSDHSAVEKLLKASGKDDSENEPLTGKDAPRTASQIMASMDFIGGKITEVSTHEMQLKSWC